MASDSGGAVAGWLVLVMAVCLTLALGVTDSDHEPLDQTMVVRCPECESTTVPPLDPERMHFLRLEAIKAQLLSKLKLNRRPNVTSSVPRQVLLETVLRSEETEIVQVPAKSPPEENQPYTSQIITFAAPGPQHNNITTLEFNLSGRDLEALTVTEATLWIFIHRTNMYHYYDSRIIAGQRLPNTMLWLFRVPSDMPDKIHVPEYLIGSKHVRLQHTGWIRIDISEVARRWFADLTEPLRLLVDCSSCAGHIEAVLFNDQKHKGAHKTNSRLPNAAHRPFLVVKTRPSSTRRLSRRALQCDKNTRHCCKQEFFVTFKELDWEDWILAPKGYNANYCRGSCANIYQTPDSFHSVYAYLLEEVRRVRDTASITYCCAPTRLSPLTLIYIDEDDSIIKRNVPRMVVEECGCT